jgi:hypothetical protein
MPTHQTNITLGHPYRDSYTGFEGTAVSVHFYGYGVQRVTIANLDKNGAVAEQTFDAGRLEPTSTAIAGVNGSIGFNAAGA